MASVTIINQAARDVMASNDAIAEVRSKVQERCAVELQRLCNDFFDEADDFLFVSGRNGNFTEDSVYLKAMRELRTKQSLFQEAFISITSTTLFPSLENTNHDIATATRHLVERHAEIFEMLEIDLALQGMNRKAEKKFAGFEQQVEAIFTKMQAQSNLAKKRQFALVSASLWAFGEAQRVFALPVEIRLVIIKLFEQYILLKLESLFLDVINILKHRLAVGKNGGNISASTRFRVKPPSGASLRKQRLSRALSSLQDSELHATAIDVAVDTLIDEACAEPDLPGAVIELLRTHWRAVLFLIGLHRGCKSPEWDGAIHTLELLVAATCGTTELGETELDSLMEQLEKGIALLQLPEAAQQKLLQSVREYICLTKSAPAPVSTKQESKPAIKLVAEASVSPSGKKILDRDDLKELANLLGTDTVELGQARTDRDLQDFLPEIDSLADETEVEYKIDGAFQTCSLSKNPSKPGMFNITERHSRITITRSRLGLAISLQGGELKIARTQILSASSQKTRIDPKFPKTRA